MCVLSGMPVCLCLLCVCVQRGGSNAAFFSGVAAMSVLVAVGIIAFAAQVLARSLVPSQVCRYSCALLL